MGNGVTLTDNGTVWAPTFTIGAFYTPSQPVRDPILQSLIQNMYFGVVGNVILGGQTNVQSGVTSTGIPVTVTDQPSTSLEIMGRVGLRVTNSRINYGSSGLRMSPVPFAAPFLEAGTRMQWSNVQVTAPSVNDLFPISIQDTRFVFGGGVAIPLMADALLEIDATRTVGGPAT